MKILVQRGSISIVLALLLIASMVSVVIAEGESCPAWYLGSDDHTAGGKGMALVAAPGTDNVTIAAGSEQLWLASVPATYNVSIEGGLWAAYLQTDSNWSSNCTVEIGSYNVATSAFSVIPTTSAASVYWNGYDLEIEVQYNPAIILKDDYLALKVKNEDTEDHVIVTEDSCSRLVPPCTSEYPVPELPTVVLLGVGLLSLFGYLALRGQKESPAKAQ